MFSRFTRAVACIRTSFLFIVEYYSIIWMYHLLFIHLSVWWTFGSFHFLVIMNNTAMNTRIQIFVWTYVFISTGYLLRNIIAESHGHPVFNLLRNCHSVSQSGCTILHPHQQRMRAPVFPNLCQHLLSVFLMVLYVGVILHFIMALICISLMASTEKAMAPHSSVLAWKIPWAEEPGGLLSMGLHRVGHDWSNLAAAAAAAMASKAEHFFTGHLYTGYSDIFLVQFKGGLSLYGWVVRVLYILWIVVAVHLLSCV